MWGAVVATAGVSTRPGRLHRRRLLGEPRAGRMGLGGGVVGAVRQAGAEAAEHQPAHGAAGGARGAPPLDGPLEVRSDSTYVVNCFRDRWWEGWLKRGWTNSQKKPVANRDLWEPLIEAYRRRTGEIDLHLGQGPQLRSDERRRRPPGGRGVADPAAPFRRHAAGGGRPRPGRPAGGARRPRSPGSSPRRRSGTGPRSSAGTTRTRWRPGCAARLAEILAAKKQLHPDLWLLTGLLPRRRAAGGRGGPGGRRALPGRPALPGAGAAVADGVAGPLRRADPPCRRRRPAGAVRARQQAEVRRRPRPARRLAGQARRRGPRRVGRPGPRRWASSSARWRRSSATRSGSSTRSPDRPAEPGRRFARPAPG